MNELTEGIASRIRNRWRLRRLYLYYVFRLPNWGQSLVLAQILIIGLHHGAGFSKSQLRRVMRTDVSESLPAHVKRWLSSLVVDGGYIETKE